jgi:hypothetical protein
MRMLFLASVLLSLHLMAETTQQGGGVPATATSVSLDPARFGMATSCRRLIQSDGSLGDWGQEMVRAINRVGSGCFYNQANFSSVCPNYSRFNQERKTQFLAFLFASIAHYESSCRLNARAQGTNDIADGLFQLEHSFSQRRRAGRHPQFCATGGPTNTQALRFQMECGMSIFHAGYCARNGVVGETSWYWQKLNRPTRQITRMARRFPYCGN